MTDIPSNANPVFLLGGVKCGTTFLYNQLKQHPNLCFSKPKEPDFFMLDKVYSKGVNYYFTEYFDHYSGESVFGDARTNNFYLPWVPDRISASFPSAKLVAVVRDPVDRTYSEYYHARRHAAEGLPFEESLVKNFERIKRGRRLMTRSERKNYQDVYLNNRKPFYRMYLDHGYYAEMIARYQRYYPENNFRIIKFDNLIKSPLETCNSIFDFLDLDPLDKLQEGGKNTGTVPRSYVFQNLLRFLGEFKISEYIPYAIKNRLIGLNLEPKSNTEPMNLLTKHWLAQHYKPHNKRLSEFVDFNTGDWTTPEESLELVRD